jgi:hypothetical protein
LVINVIENNIGALGVLLEGDELELLLSEVGVEFGLELEELEVGIEEGVDVTLDVGVDVVIVDVVLALLVEGVVLVVIEEVEIGRLKDVLGLVDEEGRWVEV